MRFRRIFSIHRTISGDGYLLLSARARAARCAGARMAGDHGFWHGQSKVFDAVDIKGKYTGLAFGMGVERIAMLKHGFRIFVYFENDSSFRTVLSRHKS